MDPQRDPHIARCSALPPAEQKLATLANRADQIARNAVECLAQATRSCHDQPDLVNAELVVLVEIIASSVTTLGHQLRTAAA